MRRVLFLLSLLTSQLQAVSKPAHVLYRISQVMLVGANIADTHSSWGKLESNPVLGRQVFGIRQAGIKVGIISGWLLLNDHILRKRVGEKTLIMVNLGIAGTLGSIAMRNYSIVESKDLSRIIK